MWDRNIEPAEFLKGGRAGGKIIFADLKQIIGTRLSRRLKQAFVNKRRKRMTEREAKQTVFFHLQLE